MWGTRRVGVEVAPTAIDTWARARVLGPLYGLLAIVLTWPLAAHLTGSLAYGTERAPTVGLFNLWTLRWNQDRAGHLFAGYWDAPIFHPTASAFALSEPQPLTGLLFTPLSWVTGNPVLAANLVMLAVLAANGWAAARLARHLGVAAAPAALAGVLAQGMPFVATQMGVLQLTVVFPLFLLVDAIVGWASGSGGRRTAAGIGLWLAVTFLTCGYYGLFAVVGIGVPALLLVRRSWLSRSRVIDLGVAVAVFAVLALPVVISQARITADYTRSDEVIQGLSATADDFWALDSRAHGTGPLPWLHQEGSGRGLYPGTALLVLGAGGFALAYGRLQRDALAVAADHPGSDGETEGADPAEGADPVDRRRVLVFLVAGALLARLLALGLNLSIGGWQPYELLRTWVPGFASLRSPFRFAVLTEVFLVPLTAFALDALWHWRPRPGPGRAWGAVAALVIVVAGVVEVGIMPVHLFRVDQSTPDWAAWLDDQPAEADREQRPGDGSVAFVPFPADYGVADYEDTTRRMLQALDADAATVNGYSGLFPADYEELEVAMHTYPNYEADDLLRRFGVSYLVVDAEWLEEPGRDTWLSAVYLRVFDGRDAVIFEMP